MRAANAVGPTHVRLTPEGSRRIRVYRNGDTHFKGITIVLNMRQLYNIDSLLDMISEKIGLVMGCKRLYTLDGTPVKSMEQLQHNTEYVAASGAFTPVRYGRAGPASLHSNSLLTRSSSNFSGASREDPLAQSAASKQSAPASLALGGAHAPLRPSRSIEPRRTVGRPPPSAPTNGPTSRKKAAREGSKKRRASKKKASTDESSAGEPLTAPIEAAAPEAEETAEQREENGQREEEAVTETTAEEPAPRTRTEVEVVEHEEREEELDQGSQHQQQEEEQEEEEEEEGHAAATPADESARAPSVQADNEAQAEEDGQMHHPQTVDEQKTNGEEEEEK